MRVIAFMVMLSLVFVLTTAVANAAYDWMQKSPASNPSAREYHALSYIAEDKVLLFAGRDAPGYDDETWVYDLSEDTWTQQNPAIKPPTRRHHDLAYIGEDKVLLFGGADTKDDTWVYDLSENSWTQMSPAEKPFAREGHKMAYIGGDQVLLFGGHNYIANSDETWLYDLSEGTWTQQNPASKPPARKFHDMVHLGGGQILLFGGYVASADAETWLYDLSENTWTQQLPTVQPSSRWMHAMSYIGGDQVLLFGGYHDDLSFDDETWIYDLSDNTWTQVITSIQPSPRFGHALSETSLDGSTFCMLFGGQDGSFDDETWTFAVPLELAVDIKPGSCPNPLNVNSQGVLPVAILGTEDFDVYDIDPATVLLEGVSPLRWNFQDVATPVEPGADTCTCTTLGSDGYMDLTLKFDTPEIAMALYPIVDGEVRVLTLTGMTYDSISIMGQDCVRIIWKRRNPKFPSAITHADFGRITSTLGTYPNPFNAETSIFFGLPEKTPVSLVVYNVLGEKVRTLVNEEMDAGYHTVYWNGRDETGGLVASGIYFYRFESNLLTKTQKMVLLK